MATLEQLQQRIQRLEDIKQIERLQRIYGYYQDYGEWEKVVDLFSDNAESVEECDYGVYKGKEGIRHHHLICFHHRNSSINACNFIGHKTGFERPSFLPSRKNREGRKKLQTS